MSFQARSRGPMWRSGRVIIVGFGDYLAKEIIDVEGDFLCPGLIDGHVHIESSMVTIPEFARAVLPHGTTTVVTDPHEIANVLGARGIRFMAESARGIPLNVFIMIPSCVPATHHGDLRSGSQGRGY